MEALASPTRAHRRYAPARAGGAVLARRRMEDVREAHGHVGRQALILDFLSVRREVWPGIRR